VSHSTGLDRHLGMSVTLVFVIAAAVCWIAGLRSEQIQ
jgi:hypothetical protein